MPGSPKPAQRSAEEKQERSRKPSVSKIPSPTHKPGQPDTRKISVGSTEQARGPRSLPSTPRERKSSTTRQNGPQNSVTKDPKSGPVKDRGKAHQTPPSPRRELASTPPNESVIKGRTRKNVTKMNRGEERENGENEIGSEQIESDEIKDDQLNIPVFEESNNIVLNGQLNGQCNNLSEIVDTSCSRDISSPDERFSELLKPTMNGRRKTSECSFETDSDVTSDILSDLTDTDYDLRSQRYSGLSEASSEMSFGTSPAGKLFHSVELERNALETTVEQENSELGISQQSLRDCLMNLNLQGSVTPTMKRRIFETAPSKDAKEESPDIAEDPLSRPLDKALFFDVEKSRGDTSPDEEDSTNGSPRRWSLVQSLISSIEKRSGKSSDSPRRKKNVAAVGSTSNYVVSASKHKIVESAVNTQATMSNHQAPRARLPSFDELRKVMIIQLNYLGYSTPDLQYT